RVAAMPGVRAQLLGLQRKLGQGCPRGAVLEGRDIGTVVFPGADVKFFFVASARERARRRVKDLENAGQTADLDEVQQSIERRDRLDSRRATAPLRRADDALIVDTDRKTEDEVVDHLVTIIRRTQATATRG
ncbi:MAG: (d)CMP kinase, partial [Myxococcota bacterium]